jgi:hypothetical protein
MAVHQGPGLCYCDLLAQPHKAHQDGVGGISLQTEEGAVVFNPDLSKPTETYVGGGQREANAGRPRYDLMWTRSQPLDEQMLTRDAKWIAYGSAKYGERNWEAFEGPDALARCEASLGRHYAAFMLGEDDEDHAAAIRANVQFIEYIRWRMIPDGSTEGPF